MGKIIFWIVVVFVVLFVLRLVNIAKSRRAEGGRERAADERKPAGAMVRCTQCGIFLPKADAVPSAQGFRCGDPDCAQRHGNAR